MAMRSTRTSSRAMTTTDVDAAKRELRQVGRELKKINGRADTLFERRLALFRTLRDAGLPHREIAELGSTNVENVRFALHKAARQGSSAGRGVAR